MGEMVSFEASGRTVAGYLALPAEAGPGLLVIQEFWGLVPHIKDVADRFAAAGFVALAPDLYEGVTYDHPDEARRRVMELNVDRAADDLSGAVDLLLEHERTRGPAVGVVGFCLGGGLAVFLASQRPEVAAVVNFYGLLRGVQPDVSRIRGAVLGHFASRDVHIPAEAHEELLRRLREAGVPAEHHVYEADHAFFNETRPPTRRRRRASPGSARWPSSASASRNEFVKPSRAPRAAPRSTRRERRARSRAAGAGRAPRWRRSPPRHGAARRPPSPPSRR